jgi:hypothetical protein
MMERNQSTLPAATIPSSFERGTKGAGWVKVTFVRMLSNLRQLPRTVEVLPYAAYAVRIGMMT